MKLDEYVLNWTVHLTQSVRSAKGLIYGTSTFNPLDRPLETWLVLKDIGYLSFQIKNSKKSQYVTADGCRKRPQSENETRVSFDLSNICLSNTGFTLSKIFNRGSLLYLGRLELNVTCQNVRKIFQESKMAPKYRKSKVGCVFQMVISSELRIG